MLQKLAKALCISYLFLGGKNQPSVSEDCNCISHIVFWSRQCWQLHQIQLVFRSWKPTQLFVKPASQTCCHFPSHPLPFRFIFFPSLASKVSSPIRLRRQREEKNPCYLGFSFSVVLAQFAKGFPAYSAIPERSLLINSLAPADTVLNSAVVSTKFASAWRRGWLKWMVSHWSSAPFSFRL